MSPSSVMVKRADETSNPVAEPATATVLELPGVESSVTVRENDPDPDCSPAGIVIGNCLGLRLV